MSCPAARQRIDTPVSGAEVGGVQKLRFRGIPGVDSFLTKSDAADNLECWPQNEQILTYGQRAIAAVGQKFDSGNFDLQSRHFAVAFLKTFPAALRAQIERVFQREREGKLLLSRQFNDFGYFLTFDLIITYAQLVLSDVSQNHLYARRHSELSPPRPFEDIRYHFPLAIFRLGVGKGTHTKPTTPSAPATAPAVSSSAAAGNSTAVVGESRNARRTRERNERRVAAATADGGAARPPAVAATAASSPAASSSGTKSGVSKPYPNPAAVHAAHPRFKEPGFKLRDKCFKCMHRADFVDHTNGTCTGQIQFRKDFECYFHGVPGSRNVDDCPGRRNCDCPLQRKFGWYDTNGNPLDPRLRVRSSGAASQIGSQQSVPLAATSSTPAAPARAARPPLQALAAAAGSSTKMIVSGSTSYCDAAGNQLRPVAFSHSAVTPTPNPPTVVYITSQPLPSQFHIVALPPVVADRDPLGEDDMSRFNISYHSAP